MRSGKIITRPVKSYSEGTTLFVERVEALGSQVCNQQVGQEVEDEA
ncbi:hypothetical protein [Bacillus yapensis]|nr:hypothetical protein [Bacillus yapensis]